MEITKSDAEECVVGFDGYIFREDGGSNHLVGTLTTERLPGDIRVRVKSTKFGNCILRWKKWLFDVIPVGVGAITAIPDGVMAAVLTGLQAIKAAVDTMQVEFAPEASTVIVNIVRWQPAAELSGNSSWIAVAMIKTECQRLGPPLTEEQVLTILHDFDRLKVLQFDITEENVRVVEEIAFVDAS